MSLTLSYPLRYFFRLGLACCRIFPLILCLVLLQACASTKVSTDYQRGARFHEYRSYTATPHHSRPHSLPLRQLEDSLKRSLPAEGLLESRPGQSPDLNIRFGIDSNSYHQRGGGPNARVGVGSRTGNVGYGVSLGFPIFGRGGTRAEGVINIDFFDAKTGQLLWWAEKPVKWNEEKTGSMSTAITKAVQDMLDHYPPGSGGFFIWPK